MYSPIPALRSANEVEPITSMGSPRPDGCWLGAAAGSGADRPGGWAPRAFWGRTCGGSLQGIIRVGMDEFIRRNPRLFLINEYARAVGAQPPGRCGVGIRRRPWVGGIAQGRAPTGRQLRLSNQRRPDRFRKPDRSCRVRRFRGVSQHFSRGPGHGMVVSGERGTCTGNALRLTTSCHCLAKWFGVKNQIHMQG